MSKSFIQKPFMNFDFTILKLPQLLARPGADTLGRNARTRRRQIRRESREQCNRLRAPWLGTRGMMNDKEVSTLCMQSETDARVMREGRGRIGSLISVARFRSLLMPYRHDFFFIIELVTALAAAEPRRGAYRR